MWSLIHELKETVAVAEWISAGVAVLALVGVVYEYNRQKGDTRLQLGQEMIEKLTTDELLFFAVTVLDWGSGLVVVPESWRGVVGKDAVEWSLADIREALRPQISDQTRTNPRQLLYRHAFVQLFNHLERVAAFEERGAVEIEDLKTMAWLAQQLDCWDYAPEGEKQDFFKPTMDFWYPNQAPQNLIAKLVAAYPRNDTTEPTKLPSGRT